jgi:hypothetical protein
VRAAGPAGEFGPVGHAAEDSQFDGERTAPLPRVIPPAPAASRGRAEVEPAQPSVLSGSPAESLFESDERVAPPVIGESSGRDPWTGGQGWR